jgi:hypothetical protein
LWGPGGRRRAGESGEERHLLRKDGYLPLPIASARPALAFVSAHAIAELRLHLGTAHDLAPKVTPAVIGLHVCHLQGFVHPFGHALGDLLPMRVSAASNQSKCSATSCPPRHVGMPDETNPRAGTFGAKIAQATAGRRSGNIASQQRRGRRVNNRKSFSFSSEAFAGVRITHRHKKKPSPRASRTTSNMRCSLSRLSPGATVARSGKEDCDGSKNNKRLVAPNYKLPIWTHDYPIWAWPASEHQHAGPGFSAAEALSATRSHAERRRRRRISAGRASKSAPK